ncbi:hypothetical protein TWF730_008923 [Orbilia blumenaviensis]|uniref:Uncharacterized protein n=1 Tax=Orbilia blumenaviensis TaxID=1796055 RepID=A0AAV9V063_9PEZI
MKFQAIVFSSLALFINAVPVLSAPTGDPASEPTGEPTSNLLANPEYGPMRWTGSIEGGPELDLQGTLQEVLPQILALNPGWEPPLDVANFLAPTKEKAKRFAPTPTTDNPSLVKRYFKNRPTCNALPGNYAEGWVIEGFAIPWLRVVGEAGVMCGADPHICAKSYCEYGSKVELCNDRTTRLEIRCDRLSGAAGEIVKDCGEFIHGDNRIKGHWWDTTTYAAAVRMSLSGNCL